MKKCRECGVKLLAGINWTEGNVKKQDYICQECKNAKARDDYENTPERQTNRRVWHVANPDKAQASREAYRKDNPEKHAATWYNSYLKRTYGITLADYGRMLEDQGGGCAICGRTVAEEGRRLAVDHNHETGEVCGLLCGGCNKGIGGLQDNSVVVRAALLYLQRWGR